MRLLGPSLRCDRALVLLTCLLVPLLFQSRDSQAQQRPLITEDVETVKSGSVRIDLGFDFLHDKDFTLSGLNGDLSRIGVVNVAFGLSPNAEFELGGVVYDHLDIDRQYRPSLVPLRFEPAANSTHDTGDFYLAAKIRLRGERRQAPGVGFRFGVQLPNTNETRGIGVNQTNFFATVLGGKSLGKVRVSSLLGLGILTAPVDEFTQNDVLLYGLATSYEVNDRLSLMSEVNGRHSTRKTTPVGTESDGAARVGARLRAAGLYWDLAGIRGLYAGSEEIGVTLGASCEVRLFRGLERR